MKRTMMIVMLAGLAAPAMANCGNGPAGAGQGCSNGGTTVTNVTNVNNVTNVTNTGTVNQVNNTGVDPRMNEAKLGLDAAIRLYDGKRVQVQAYNIYSPSMHTSEDAIGDGRNLQYGIRLVFKLGQSYEEGLIERQSRDIMALEAALSKMQK